MLQLENFRPNSVKLFNACPKMIDISASGLLFFYFVFFFFFP